jgi:hypothetical protein
MDNITRTALIEKSIQSIQAEIELLKKIGVGIFDSDNPDYAVESLTYSKKHDEFVLKFEEVQKYKEPAAISGWSNRGV